MSETASSFTSNSLVELHVRAGEFGYDKQQEAIAPYVEAVATDGLFDIVDEYKP
jgi:hypothetical protein